MIAIADKMERGGHMDEIDIILSKWIYIEENMEGILTRAEISLANKT